MADVELQPVIPPGIGPAENAPPPPQQPPPAGPHEIEVEHVVPPAVEPAENAPPPPQPSAAQQIAAYNDDMRKKEADERLCKRVLLVVALLLMVLETISATMEMIEYLHTDTPAPAPAPAHQSSEGERVRIGSASAAMAMCIMVFLVEIWGAMFRTVSEEPQCLPICCGDRISYLGWPAVDNLPRRAFRGSSAMWTGLLVAIINSSCAAYVLATVSPLNDLSPAPPMFSLVPFILSVVGFVNKVWDLFSTSTVVVRCLTHGTQMVKSVRVRGQPEILCLNCSFDRCTPLPPAVAV